MIPPGTVILPVIDVGAGGRNKENTLKIEAPDLNKLNESEAVF